MFHALIHNTTMKLFIYILFCNNFSVYQYICQAIANFMKDKTVYEADKELYVGFCDIPTRHK